MMTRRLFLARGTLIAGSAMFATSLARADAKLQAADARLWAVNAGGVKVAPGPWRLLPVMPAGVRLENLYLIMPEGVRLNAFLYLPTMAQSATRVPAPIETLPYRYAPADDSYDARNGYASLFVDVRGTGASEGVPLDEYSHAEHEDTALVIEWLSKQPWCSGKVGMYGGSYGAFNSLQMAYEMKPPALKAVFLKCGTDNRYTDDIHCPGGTMLMVDQSWALGMLSLNCMPGAPDYVLDNRAALDRWNAAPWLQGFLRHQVDGPYWRHGSLAPDYSRLTTPAFIVGGYLDIYQNQVPRIMRHATNAVTRGILGPWHHSLSTPGPQIDIDALRLRWFDHWLKGRDTGMLNEPRASFYMPRWRRQSFRFTDDVPGEWRYLQDWPDTMFSPTAQFFLRPETERPLAEALALDPVVGASGWLTDIAGPASAQRLLYCPGTGGGDQSFGPTSGEGYYGIDRRIEDTYGLRFDLAELTAPLEILGFAKATLFVSSSAPVANWIVRLCDVAPDGTSYLVARGYLNATHRRSHTNPEPLVPGQVYELDIELMCTAYRFDPEHRIRIVISNSDFPVLWPSPQPMTTTLHTGGEHPSHIRLPVLPRLSYRLGSLPASKGERRSGLEQGHAVDDSPWYESRRDLQHGINTAILNLPFGGKIECVVADDQPGNASMKISTAETGEQSGRRVEVRSEGTLRSTPTDFIMDIRCTLTENGKEIRTREWNDTVKRRLV